MQVLRCGDKSFFAVLCGAIYAMDTLLIIRRSSLSIFEVVKSLDKVKLASDFAKPHATGEDMKYFILLLITDGVTGAATVAVMQKLF